MSTTSVAGRFAEDVAGQTIELHLGRGPEVSQIVTMRVSKDFVMGTPDDPWAREGFAAWPKEGDET